MSRRLATASGAVLLTLALASCAASTAPDPEPPAPTSTGGPVASGAFPGCDEVLAAMPDVLAGLAYDETVSAGQTAQEAYEQRVCVYTTGDAAAQIGVTIAAIPFLDTEIETYGAAPTTLQDERTAQYGAVLQTLKIGDADDGHLDSALYLFDQNYSITIQGITTGGGSTVESLPQLSIDAAADAAFAVRALVD